MVGILWQTFIDVFIDLNNFHFFLMIPIYCNSLYKCLTIIRGFRKFFMIAYIYKLLIDKYFYVTLQLKKEF